MGTKNEQIANHCLEATIDTARIRPASVPTAQTTRSRRRTADLPRVEGRSYHIALTYSNGEAMIVPSMKKLRIDNLRPSPNYLLPTELGDAKVASGGVYVFKPGETAHPEARHVHEVDEVFVFIQGRGVIPIDGVDHPVQTGDVVIVEAGEDHHTRSSVEDPLVAAWWVMDRKRS